MTEGLVPWLRAQMAEDERRLRAMDEHLSGHERPYDPQDPTDPARLLAEIDAKRRIIDEHYVTEGYNGWKTGAVCGRCSEDDMSGGLSGDPYPCMTIRLLALPCADRPGYRAEWRPAG